MQALSLLALRVTTGLLLVIWGLIKVAAPDAAIGVSDKYYEGLLSSAQIQMGLGATEIALGLLVVLGLLRAITYPLQALVLIAGAAAIWKYLVDPLGQYLLTQETAQVLFFPSSTVAVATLVLLAFKDHDRLALDRLIWRS
jgi:putative oxidoreductase